MITLILAILLATAPIHPREAVPGRYYGIADSVFLCHAPGVFVTGQGKLTGAGDAPLYHFPRYLADGGEAFGVGVQTGQGALPADYWEQYVQWARREFPQ